MLASTKVPLSRLGTLAVGALVLTVACEDPTSTGPDSARSTDADNAFAAMPSPDAANPLYSELPFQLNSSAVLLLQDFAPDFGPPTFGRSTFASRCSTPSDFLLRFALDGQATYLGHFTAIAEHCTVIDFAAGSGTEIDGVLVFTAANGDELWDDYEGTNAPGQGFQEQHTFVGGTGRFENASGGGVASGDCDQAAGTCVFMLNGVIEYDASGRGE